MKRWFLNSWGGAIFNSVLWFVSGFVLAVGINRFGNQPTCVGMANCEFGPTNIVYGRDTIFITNPVATFGTVSNPPTNYSGFYTKEFQDLWLMMSNSIVAAHRPHDPEVAERYDYYISRVGIVPDWSPRSGIIYTNTTQQTNQIFATRWISSPVTQCADLVESNTNGYARWRTLGHSSAEADVVIGLRSDGVVAWRTNSNQ